MMEVKKIMTKNPACCTSDSTLQEVAHMMEMYDCGCIPVVEDHKTNKPVGTITDRDIAIRSLSENKNPLEMKASDIMTTDIETVTPETSLEQCRDKMEERQIRRILVVDKTGRCVGIVAQADIVQNESNSRQTAEFIRDVSQPSNSARRGNSYERENYQNFSNQNRGYEQDFQNRNYDRSFQNRTHERDYSAREDRYDREDSYSRSYPRQEREVKKFRTEKKSFFSPSNLLPLLLGIGAGVGLKYLLPIDQKVQKTFVPREKVTSSVHTVKETTPKVTVGTPTEIHVHSKDKSDITTGKITTSTVDVDKDTNTEIGRSARL